MTDLIKTGIYLILAGFVLIFIGTIISARNPSFGGMILIGPVPVVFGTSPWITMTAMVFGLIIMLLFFMTGRRND